MLVEIRESGFDPWREIRSHEQKRLTEPSRVGAAAVFVGTMRDVNEGDVVSGMTLEHYPEMTERHLRGICERAMQQWDIADLLLLHRVGEVRPGEAIVLVAVWSGHRAEAYAANRFIMEDLKSKAPFWKKEQLASGARWVTRNTPG